MNRVGGVEYSKRTKVKESRKFDEELVVQGMQRFGSRRKKRHLEQRQRQRYSFYDS